MGQNQVNGYFSTNVVPNIKSVGKLLKHLNLLFDEDEDDDDVEEDDEEEEEERDLLLVPSLKV